MRNFFLASLTLVGIAASAPAQYVIFSPSSGSSNPWYGPSPFRSFSSTPTFPPYFGTTAPSPYFGTGSYGSGMVNPGAAGFGGVTGTPLLMPGFAVGDTPRKRDSIYPAATRLPSREEIAARLNGDERTTINLTVPTASARVTIAGARMTQTGQQRTFVTPPLGEGDYSLTFVVEWDDTSGRQTRTRTVNFQPGEKRSIIIN